MPVLFTAITRIKDWRALQALHRDALLSQARRAGAQRFHVYRDVNDASQVLVTVELPDQEAAREMGRAWCEVTTLVGGGLSDDRCWEPTGWEGIEPVPAKER